MNLRKIWCTDRLPSFQNAIQAGDYIIDAATDTFDPYKYPVKISKIEDAGLRNAADHADICATIESYWRVDCYPNIYFPQLAPFFPVIGVTQEGRVGFMCQNMRHMDAQNLIGGDFLSAKNFIFNSPFSHKRLLPKHLESLHWIPPIGRDSDRHAYQAMEKPKIQSVEKMFKHVHLYSPEILANVFLHHFSSMHNSALDIH